MTYFYYTCCIVLLLQIVSGYATTANIAIGKEATFCNKLVDPGKLTDGDKNTSVYMKSDCTPNTELIIRLGKPYYVTYVIIHPGTHTEALEYCIINMNGPEGPERCADYPFKIIKAGAPMKINCRDHNKLFSEIIVKPLYYHKANFDIAEIEVFSLALENEKYPLLHRGCYAHIEGVPEAMSWEKCQQNCFDGNYIFAAIKANSHCVCSNDLQPNQLRNDYECDIPCEGHRYCGGTNAFSVYIVKPPLPYYIGCYPDANYTWVPSQNLTTVGCLRSCRTSLFFAMKEKTFCTCMDYQPMGALHAQLYCDQSCGGNESQACGSEIAMTSFTSCVRGNYKLNCDNYTMCAQDYDHFLVCDYKGCQSGFSGEHCMHRDFTTTTEITTLTSPNQTGDEDQEKTLMRRLRNILPLIIGGIIAICSLLFTCRGAVKEESSKPSEHTSVSTRTAEL